MLDCLDIEPADASWTPQNWAARITACWREAFRSILEVGNLLTQAKAALAHGEWEAMCESSLPFSASTASRLMAIAADSRLSNPAHAPFLPPAWTTLYELTKLTDDEFKAGIDAGAIHPELERKALINGARSLMGSRVEPSDSLDYFPTPPWATRALLERVLLPHLGGEPLRSAWEPACGEGHIAEVLAEYFKSVAATDIHGYGYGAGGQDFLDAETEFHADWIITNPPFGDLTEKFVALALQRAKVGVAMFVRLQWLEGVGRYERIYRDTPPTIVALFAERVPLCKGCYDPTGDTATAYIWLVWIKGTEPRRPVWIPPGQREALTKPDDAERFTTHPVTRRAA